MHPSVALSIRETAVTIYFLFLSNLFHLSLTSWYYTILAQIAFFVVDKLSQITAIETSYYAGYLDCSVQKKTCAEKIIS